MTDSALWLAVPPEVHSALLSTGSGPGPLFSAAQAWQALAAEYADAAKELTGLLATVRAGLWEGAAAERYVAAYQPYLAWLSSASAVAEQNAAQHDTAAAGYLAALDAMPTLAELAVNHAVHGALLATNFLGVNAIPIALNEADYVRMWVQAATTMSAYQALAQESVASTSPSSAAPRILSSDSVASSSSSDPTTWLLQELRTAISDLQQMVNNLPEPLRGIVSQALDSISSVANSTVFTIVAYSILDPIIYFGPFTSLLAPAAAAASVAAVAAVQPAGDVPQQSIPGTGTHPLAPVRQTLAAVSPAPLGGSGMSAPGSAPMSLPGAPTTATAAQPLGAQGYFYALASGPDGEGFTPTTGTGARSTAEAVAGAKAPESAQAASSARRRARRRRPEIMTGDGRMTMSADDAAPPAEPIATASRRGSGSLGFAGATEFSASTPARGMAQVPEGMDDAIVTEPMLPGTWQTR